MKAVAVDKLFFEWIQALEVHRKPNEWEVKALLKDFGFPVLEEFLLRKDSPADSTGLEDFTAGKKGNGFAVKICSAEVLHKSDIGGVRLNIPADRLISVLEEFRELFPGQHLLVSEMAVVSGPEFILGAMSDPVLGPAVMAGAGGILTELYRDVAFRLAPCSEFEAGSMLDELAVSPVLNGYRSSSMDGLALRSILLISAVWPGWPEKTGMQLDINPLIWDGSRWLILDAKAVLS